MKIIKITSEQQIDVNSGEIIEPFKIPYRNKVEQVQNLDFIKIGGNNIRESLNLENINSLEELKSKKEEIKNIFLEYVRKSDYDINENEIGEIKFLGVDYNSDEIKENYSENYGIYIISISVNNESYQCPIILGKENKLVFSKLQDTIKILENKNELDGSRKKIIDLYKLDNKNFIYCAEPIISMGYRYILVGKGDISEININRAYGNFGTPKIENGKIIYSFKKFNPSTGNYDEKYDKEEVILGEESKSFI